MGGGAVSIREQFGAPYKSTSSSSPSSSSVVVGVDHGGWEGHHGRGDEMRLAGQPLHVIRGHLRHPVHRRHLRHGRGSRSRSRRRGGRQLRPLELSEGHGVGWVVGVGGERLDVVAAAPSAPSSPTAAFLGLAGVLEAVVAVQVGVVGEGGPADGTDVGAVAGVGSLVHLEGGRAGELLLAHVALVRLLPCAMQNHQDGMGYSVIESLWLVIIIITIIIIIIIMDYNNDDDDDNKNNNDDDDKRCLPV